MKELWEKEFKTDWTSRFSDQAHSLAHTVYLENKTKCANRNCKCYKKTFITASLLLSILCINAFMHLDNAHIRGEGTRLG